MGGPDIERLIQLLAKLPGLGPRSARRAALYLMTRKDSLMVPLGDALANTAARVTACGICGNLDSVDPCAICRDNRRDPKLLCVVEDVGDLWALERTASFRGRYHVLGGTLSALDGIKPEDLSIGPLLARLEASAGEITEVILALNATIDGQTTVHYLSDRLKALGLKVSRIAHGVPVGGELDYLDDGTLSAALASRRVVGSN
jgi:recombination protein RecR